MDRCPEERVIEVLEAVNLLMAFPLFVVVVGVDQRWVKNALVKRYQLQFTGQLAGHGKIDDIEKIEASNYLEKIFQVPFHLKEATDNNVKEMLKKLSVSNNEPKYSENIQGNLPEEIELTETIVGNTIEKQSMLEDISMGGTTKTQIVSSVNIDQNSVTNETPEYLKLSEREVELMQELSSIIGTNPRAIKRFVNVYQIARAHEGFIFQKEYEDKEFLILMFLLALPMGPYQNITEEIYNHFTYSPPFLTLNAHIEEYKSGGVKVNGFLEVVSPKMVNDYSNLLEIINNSSIKDLILNFNPEQCKEHLQFIKRFTFEDAKIN